MLRFGSDLEEQVKQYRGFEFLQHGQGKEQQDEQMAIPFARLAAPSPAHAVEKSLQFSAS